MIIKVRKIEYTESKQYTWDWDSSLIIINLDQLVIAERSFILAQHTTLSLRGMSQITIDMELNELEKLLDAKNCL
jgi:hypothetical protein